MRIKLNVCENECLKNKVLESSVSKMSFLDIHSCLDLGGDLHTYCLTSYVLKQRKAWNERQPTWILVPALS